MTTSVALCTYNGEKFLKQQIDSILNQTVCVDEIIICDDCSTDKTVEILNDYKIKFPDLFQIFINEKNLRSVKNFEKAISLCTKDIIFLCDQDDVWKIEKVNLFLKKFAENSNYKVICSNAELINEEGNSINKNTIWDVPFYFKKNRKKIDYFKSFCLIGNFATGANMAFDRDFISTILPFPEKNFHHDEWLAIVSSAENKFLFFDKKTAYYRIHQNQQVGGVFFENKKNIESQLFKRFNLENQNISFRILKRRILNLKKKKEKILSISGNQKSAIKTRLLQTIDNYLLNLKFQLKKENSLKYYFFELFYF